MHSVFKIKLKGAFETYGKINNDTVIHPVWHRVMQGRRNCWNWNFLNCLLLTRKYHPNHLAGSLRDQNMISLVHYISGYFGEQCFWKFLFHREFLNIAAVKSLMSGNFVLTAKSLITTTFCDRMSRGLHERRWLG